MKDAFTALGSSRPVGAVLQMQPSSTNVSGQRRDIQKSAASRHLSSRSLTVTSRTCGTLGCNLLALHRGACEPELAFVSRNRPSRSQTFQDGNTSEDESDLSQGTLPRSAHLRASSSNTRQRGSKRANATFAPQPRAFSTELAQQEGSGRLRTIDITSPFSSAPRTREIDQSCHTAAIDLTSPFSSELSPSPHFANHPQTKSRPYSEEARIDANPRNTSKECAPGDRAWKRLKKRAVHDLSLIHI